MAPLIRFTDLSFVESKRKPWAPDRSGSYADQCSRGRRYAKELMIYMRGKDDPLPYSQVVRAMSAPGSEWGGVEIGFCTEIGINLLAGCPVNTAMVIGQVAADRGGIRAVIPN